MRLRGTSWKMRIVALAAAVLAVQAETVSAASTQTTEPVIGWKAVDALIGNTLILTWPSFTSAVYFLPDGTGFSARQDGEARGDPGPVRWGVQSDDKVCVAATGQAFSDESCTHISMVGDSVTLVLDEQAKLSGRVAQGDAWKLEAGVDTIAGKAAAEALIGNTLALIVLGSSEEASTYYFQADGSGRVFNQIDTSDVPKPFQWAFRDDGLCWSANGDSPGDPRCFAISITGERATLTIQGQRLYGKLLAGDARNLSRDATARTERIIDALAGNTLLYLPDPESLNVGTAAYFMADGTARSVTRGRSVADELSPAQWFLRGDGTLCAGQRGDAIGAADCAAISMTGDTVHLMWAGKTTISGKILKGDVWHLSPEAVAAQEAIAASLVGNTLVFTPANDSGEERASYSYIEANGAGRSARSNGGVVSEAKPIQWVLRGADTLCVAFGGGRVVDEDCATISMENDDVVLKPQDGPEWSGKLLPGNPWKL